MKALKITLIVIGSIIVVLVVVFGIYLFMNRQRVIEPFAVGSVETEHKVLIASQGSDFKNALVESLTTHLQERQVYIRIIDVTSLQEVNEQEWDGLVLIHTTENWKLQPAVKAYLDRAKDLDKIVVVTTSGSGEWKTEDYDVDVLTSASKTKELPALITNILFRLDAILKTETPK
ncbi:MAG: hypothetical protein JSV97_13735 [candidate division WOR-3 bacterium]|nr:MAG: hypothetical protein JSV97_13735 [candidate division WOR-3 bacterium]